MTVFVGFLVHRQSINIFLFAFLTYFTSGTLLENKCYKLILDFSAIYIINNTLKHDK